MADDTRTIEAALAARFGEKLKVDRELPGLDELARIAGHRSQRHFQPRAVAPDLLKLLCACALSAPSKSDLQQCDIVVVSDRAIRRSIVATIPDMPWIMDAPVFLVFVGNGTRLPEIAKLRDKPFPNDHLDQFFNAAVDAAIVMTTFIRAAEAVGLGCCPISAIRDHPQIVSDLLRLPRRVIPVAGLCLGWPRRRARSRRGCRLRRPSSRMPMANATSPARSMLTTGGGRSFGLIGVSATSRAGARRRSMAGPKTKHGNMPSRPARISAASCAARVFVSIDATASRAVCAA